MISSMKILWMTLNSIASEPCIRPLGVRVSLDTGAVALHALARARKGGLKLCNHRFNLLDGSMRES